MADPSLYLYYHLTVRDMQGNPITTGIKYTVFTAGSDTEATIYADTVGTAKTNPVSSTVFGTDGGVIKFCAVTATVDIVVDDEDGHVVRFDSVSPSNWHNLVMPEHVSSGLKHVKLPFTNTATVETATGFSLPRKCMVVDILIETVTAVAASTIDVGTLSTGTNGDADGLVDGHACTAAGYLRPGPICTTGSNEQYMSSNTLGAFMYVASGWLAGSDAVEDVGTFVPTAYSPAAADGLSITYTTNDKAIAGYIHIFYYEFE